MKKFLNTKRHLAALFAVLVIAFALVMLGAPVITSVAIVALWQLSQFAMSKPRGGFCYIATLTDDQVEEFNGVLRDLKGFPDRIDKLETEIRRFRKQGLGGSGTGVRWLGDTPYVTDECAQALTSIFVLDAARIKGALETVVPDETRRNHIISTAQSYLGPQARAGGALTPSDIPLPTIYVPQIIELVFAYGQARKFATVFPLGAGTVKLPRLATGEDKFSFLGVGTGGISQTIGEKEVAATLVTFTANKCGGLIRLPFELEDDTFIPTGQFLARYIGRQFALLEDTTLFLGDGTSTYADITGIAKYCQTNTTYLQVLSSGNTATSEATLADFRAMRARVNPAVLANMIATGAQQQAGYYLHPSFEPLLRSFNTYPNFVVFTNENGKPMFDGWPVRWIGVSAPNSATPSIDTPFAFFGDLSYWYLGERGQVRVEVSREVFFATDELAMRALERIDVEAMAVDAMATLQTAHS